jgi:hypothetical protein
MPTTKNKRSNAPLPGWGDLSGPAERERPGLLAKVSTPRFVLGVLAAACACALYIGHVHATQALLTEVEAARTERQRLQLKKNRLQSTFDEATAPAVIYRRAEELGLEEGLGRGPAIHVGEAASETAP